MKSVYIFKKQMIILLTVILLCPIILAAFPSPTKAAEATDLKLEAKSAILLDASSGQILYENNADVPLPPASMAKMMTEYIVMENIKSGKLKWDDMVPTSQYAADVIGSGDLLAKGEQLSVKDMFSAMSIYSGNDATVALAERIAGTEEEFAKLMNEKAKQLKMSDSAHFINASGLTRADLGKYAPTTLQGETVLSAKDAAILAYHVIQEHKEILDFTKIPSQKLRPNDKAPMINWNWMLEGNKDNVNFKRYAYIGLDGLKTGHTDEAGYCFTATAERNGMRLISVVMGTVSEPKRFEETRKVLDYGFNNFETKIVVKANSEVEALKTISFKKGVALNVPVVTQSDLSFIVKKGTTDDQIIKQAQTIEESKLVAPIKKGDILGTLKVSCNNISGVVNLVATEDVDKGSWARLFFRAIKNFFGDLFKGSKKLL